MKIVKEGIRYGLPLSLAAAGGFFIGYGDRYVIQNLLDSVQVARYSLPYDILQQLENALTTPVRLAIIPVIFNMMINGDTGKASGFVSQVIKGLFFIILPTTFGISFLGEDIITLIGSEKYADSSVFLPILSIGILFGGTNFLFTVGLYFHKRTDIISYMIMAFGLFNILLNLVFIPFMGVQGAAWATLITYFFHLVVSYRLASPYLRVQLYPHSFFKALAGSFIMICALYLSRDLLPTGPMGLCVKIPIGILIYALSIFSLDSEVRSFILGVLKKKSILFSRINV
jgi:O-antigen/teichoic acid export membrane protein